MTHAKCLEQAFLACFETEHPVNAFKQCIHDENLYLTEQFRPYQGVSGLLSHRAGFIDQLLKSCWNHFLGKDRHNASLIATGGYGRGELFPHSDIDILIIVAPENRDHNQDDLARFSRFLWDIGLKPGQSVRSIDDCIQVAGEEQTIFTNLLEIRLISGNFELFEGLRLALAASNPWPSELFFPAKVAEQEQRHRKYHDTAYNLEPNIKEGPGGLRDLQIISWVFKHHYRSNTLRGLIKYGYLPRAEYENLIAARDILWRLRFALHILTNHSEDRLLFDHQRDLARQFGYLDQNQQPDVERFMQFYFKTVLDIERLNEMLLQLMNEKLVSNPSSRKPVTINEDFLSIDGYLEARTNQVFEQRPLALLELFQLLQNHPELKGIRASTLRLMRNNLDKIDDTFRNDSQANQVFLEILKTPRQLTEQLTRMNRYGILPAYLADFANIVSRMQYDLFHIYTVDQHTLFLIRNLRRFSLALHEAELPFCNTIFRLINKPEVLYIAGLFHDIAKGRGGDHSQLGETIAADFCNQHQLPVQDTKIVCWLVRNHLLMSMTAQRKDISDPDVIHDFALKVGSIEMLNHLYLLTVADIRATNPSLWNFWKDTLLKELYIAAHNALHRGLHNPIARSERIEDNIKEAQKELMRLGLSQPSIKRSWQHLSDDYFLRYSVDEITWHTLAIAASDEADLPLVLLRPQTHRGSAEIFVYTKNERGIFSTCTASLDQLGLTILDARIITTSDQYVLNSFQVLEQSGEAISDLHQQIHISHSLRQNLLHKGVIKVNRNIYKQSRQAQHFPITTKLTFLDSPNHRFTTLELITTDRAGLLSTIGQAFSELNIQLHDAKITTIGSRAEDMFYISDQMGKAIEDPDRREKLREKILSALA